MRTLLFTALISVSSLFGYSQADFDVTKTIDYKVNPSNKTVEFAEFKAGEEPSESDAMTVLGSLDNNAVSEWELMDEQVDPIGDIHRRYKRKLLGYEMVNDQAILHIRRGKIFRINSSIRPCTIAQLPNSSITKEQAEQKARPTDMGLEFFVDERVPTLLVLIYTNAWHWAWKVDAYAAKAKSRRDVFVDAETGEVIRYFEKLHEADVPSTAKTLYFGDIFFLTSLSGGVYTLKEEARGIKTGNYNQSWLFANKTDYYNYSSNWDDQERRDLGAYDAQYGGGLTFDFYMDVYGRDSYNNNHAPVNMYVNPNDFFFGNNAFWNGQELVFGAGDGSNYSPFTTLEIIGHEFTHAVVQFTAGLVYENESGALNEAIADIMGQGIERRYEPSKMNYQIGDQNALKANGHFRDMSDPHSKNHPSYYKGKYWVSGENDNGGVHTNSGVLNYWFYLLTAGKTGTNEKNQSFSVQKIDFKKAQDLVYYAMVNYLTPYSNYEDMKDITLLLAKDYYGACSFEYKQVQNAWYAVGLLDHVQNSSLANFHAAIYETCNNTDPVNFINKSSLATDFQWDFGDGSTSNVENPSHQYVNPGVYTVTLIASGPAECGVADTLTLQNCLKVNSSSLFSPGCAPTTHLVAGGYGLYGVRMGKINENYSSTSGYSDFSCSQGWEAQEGKVYTISLISGNTYLGNKRYMAWIDMNNDGQFSDDEKCLDQLLEKNIFQGDIIIPKLGSNYGVRKMRVGIGSEQNANPCESTSYTDFKDYQVKILPNVEAPIANFGVSKNFVYPLETIAILDSTLNCADSYQWIMEGSNLGTSNDKNPLITYSVPGAYNIKLMVKNNYGEDELLRELVIVVKDRFLMCEDFDVITYGADIFDSGGPNGDYGSNEDCSMDIKLECATMIDLYVEEYNFGSGDVLYMGVQEGFSGTLQSGGGTVGLGAASQNANLRFKTDGSMNGSGFRVSVTGTIKGTPSPIAFIDAFNQNQPAKPTSNVYSFRFTNARDYDSVQVIYETGSFTLSGDFLKQLPYYWSYGYYYLDIPIQRNGLHQVKLIAYFCGNKSEATREVYADYIKIDSPEAVKLFPNPTQGELYIENNLVGSLTVNDLLDYSGKKIMSLPVIPGLQQTKIDFSHLSSGVYFVRLTNPDAAMNRVIRVVID